VSVYVDDMEAEFGRLVMCHMVADTSEELKAMAAKIGVQAKWIQYPNTLREHFDICLSKRSLAVKYGAIEVSMRWVGERARALRKGEPIPAHYNDEQEPSK
jgi:hypothetical protein